MPKECPYFKIECEKSLGIDKICDGAVPDCITLLEDSMKEKQRKDISDELNGFGPIELDEKDPLYKLTKGEPIKGFKYTNLPKNL
ncbi:MAG: hypothetical protein KC516_02370 [Nanoarchaeota archaeon]|nr:hypothetical protein [Nanoarchaeota archaeon]